MWNQWMHFNAGIKNVKSFKNKLLSFLYIIFKLVSLWTHHRKVHSKVYKVQHKLLKCWHCVVLPLPSLIATRLARNGPRSIQPQQKMVNMCPEIICIGWSSMIVTETIHGLPIVKEAEGLFHYQEIIQPTLWGKDRETQKNSASVFVLTELNLSSVCFITIMRCSLTSRTFHQWQITWPPSHLPWCASFPVVVCYLGA